MPSFVSIGDTLVFSELISVELIRYDPMYGSQAEAVAYFSARVDAQLWLVSPPDQTRQCLITATRAIDCLRFYGKKTDPTQLLENPRNGVLTVPDAIRWACYEEAFSLLKKRNPDTEYGNLFVKARVFDKVRTDYDYAHAPVHILSGITSRRAWNFLHPYLVQDRTLRLRRGS